MVFATEPTGLTAPLSWSTRTKAGAALSSRLPTAGDGIGVFFSSRRRHTRSLCDWSSDVCSSDLQPAGVAGETSRIDRTAEPNLSVLLITGRSVPGLLLPVPRDGQLKQIPVSRK